MLRRHAPAREFLDDLLVELEAEIRTGAASTVRAVVYFRLCELGQMDARALSFFDELASSSELEQKAAWDVRMAASDLLFRHRRYELYLQVPTNDLEFLDEEAKDSEVDGYRERYLRLLKAYAGLGDTSGAERVIVSLLCFSDTENVRAQVDETLLEEKLDLAVPGPEALNCE